ncbi:hypothetical protein [Spiroplasma endosymbiont of Labia minor]
MTECISCKLKYKNTELYNTMYNKPICLSCIDKVKQHYKKLTLWQTTT